MTWTWTRASDGIGWPIAFVALIFVGLLWAQGAIPKEWALLIIAVLANRL